MLPCTIEQFLAVFAAYNAAIWPARVVAYLVGEAAVALVFSRAAWSDRAIAAALSLMWL